MALEELLFCCCPSPGAEGDRHTLRAAKPQVLALHSLCP